MRRATRCLLGAVALSALALASCADGPDAEVISAPTADVTKEPTHDADPTDGVASPYGSQNPADWDDAPSATLTLPDGTTRDLIAGGLVEAPDVELVLRPAGDGYLSLEIVNHGGRDIAIPDFGPSTQGSPVLIIRDVDMPYERGELEYGHEPLVDILPVPSGDSLVLDEHRIAAETDVAVCAEVIDLSALSDDDLVRTDEVTSIKLRHSSASLETACALGSAHPQGSALVDLSTDPNGDTVQVPLTDGRTLIVDGATSIRPEGVNVALAELPDGRTVLTVESTELVTAQIGRTSAVVDGVVLFSALFSADTADPDLPTQSLAVRVTPGAIVAVAEVPDGASTGCVQVFESLYTDAVAGESLEIWIEGTRHAVRVVCSEPNAPIDPIDDDVVLSDLLSE